MLLIWLGGNANESNKGDKSSVSLYDNLNTKCEGWDSNPGIPSEAGLKPAAFGLAQPPSRSCLSLIGQKWVSVWRLRRASYQSTLNEPSPCGSGAISMSFRRSMI